MPYKLSMVKPFFVAVLPSQEDSSTSNFSSRFSKYCSSAVVAKKEGPAQLFVLFETSSLYILSRAFLLCPLGHIVYSFLATSILQQYSPEGIFLQQQSSFIQSPRKEESFHSPIESHSLSSAINCLTMAKRMPMSSVFTFIVHLFGRPQVTPPLRVGPSFNFFHYTFFMKQ